jgi:eukaryotic-like serine/threonine-protein kinase
MANLLSGLTYGKKLGAGAFGEVFLGQDKAHGEVAVKVLARDVAWNETEWESWKKGFLAEAQHLSRAAHDHVVKVHYIAEADDGQSVVICMGFCPGGSLQQPYEQAPMTIAAVRKVATDVLLGLQCLHLRNMVHRDIKPANILLDARGNALIGDFGLVSDDLVLGYASQAGYSDHIAYEVWMGKGTSVKSDIWAFGATLYRLLHGRQWCDELPQPRDVIAHGAFAKQRPWLPHIPKRWRRVIRQMMEDDTTKRYQTAEVALGAVAGLPVTPPWDATVQPDKVRWEQVKGSRLHVVEWVRIPRQNKWSAWSEPMPGTTGQRKTLGGSNGVVPAKRAVSELEHHLS